MFDDVIRSLENGNFPSDPRTDIDTHHLIHRYPELGRVLIRGVVIPTANGEITARVYSSPGVQHGGLVWAHGGAFIGGDLDMPEANWVALSLAARGYSVLSVDYTKALFGRHFPIPSLDLLDAWNWSSIELGVAAERIHLGGASAGGNLAAGVALRLRDGQGRLPASLLLAYPVLHDVLPNASDEVRAAAETLRPDERFPPELMSAMSLNYAGGTKNLEDPYAFPARANLAGLPRTFVLNSQSDDLRASGEAFALDALASGVTVRVEYEPGTTHGHLNQPYSPGAQLSIQRMARWLDDFSGTSA